MSEIAYSNRELDEKLRNIHEKLDLILAQTTKTNGRVNDIEKNYVRFENIKGLYSWQYYSKGAVAVLIAIVLPILGFLSYEVVTKIK